MLLAFQVFYFSFINKLSKHAKHKTAACPARAAGPRACRIYGGYFFFVFQEKPEEEVHPYSGGTDLQFFVDSEPWIVAEW